MDNYICYLVCAVSSVLAIVGFGGRKHCSSFEMFRLTVLTLVSIALFFTPEPVRSASKDIFDSPRIIDLGCYNVSSKSLPGTSLFIPDVPGYFVLGMCHWRCSKFPWDDVPTAFAMIKNKCFCTNWTTDNLVSLARTHQHYCNEEDSYYEDDLYMRIRIYAAGYCENCTRVALPANLAPDCNMKSQYLFKLIKQCDNENEIPTPGQSFQYHIDKLSPETCLHECWINQWLGVGDFNSELFVVLGGSEGDNCACYSYPSMSYLISTEQQYEYCRDCPSAACSEPLESLWCGEHDSIYSSTLSYYSYQGIPPDCVRMPMALACSEDETKLVYVLDPENSGKFYTCDHGYRYSCNCQPGQCFSDAFQNCGLCAPTEDSGNNKSTDGSQTTNSLGTESEIPTPNPSTTEIPTPNPSTTEIPTPNPSTTEAPTPNPSTTEISTPNPSTPEILTPNPSTTEIPTPNPSTTEIPTPNPSTSPSWVGHTFPTDAATTTEKAPTTTVTPEPAIICEMKCEATDKLGRKWEGCPGEIVKQKCVGNATGDTIWKCEANGEFRGRYPDTSDCMSPWIDQLEEFADSSPEPLDPDVARHILTVIQTKCDAAMESNGLVPTYYPHEIKQLFKIGGNIIKMVTNETTDDVFENLAYYAIWVLGTVFTYQGPWEGLDVTNCSDTGTSFISAVEEAGLELSKRISLNQTFMEQSKYRQRYNKIGDFDMGCGAQLKASTEGESLTYPFQYSEEEDSYIHLPSDWSTYLSRKEVKFVGLQIMSTYVNRLFPGNLTTFLESSRGNQTGEKLVNGNLLSFTFDSSDESQLKLADFNFTGDGVKIVFRHDVEAWGYEIREIRRNLHEGERAKAVLGSGSCVFWDPIKLVWSPHGCKLVKSNRESTVCECNHLTSFALLMDVHRYTGNDIVLEILTWILSTLSIISLCTCIFIFSSSIKSSSSPRNEITNQLCICLLVGNVLLLLFMDRSYFYLGQGGCTVVAILIHYSFLAAFMWNWVEGVQLYRMVIVVFDDGKDYRMIQRILAYGLPALVVGTTVVVGLVRKEKAYGGDAFCWLEEDYIWAFMGPIAVIILINLVLLIICLRKAYDLQSNPQILQINRKEKSFTSWIKGTFSLAVLLGVTWTSGYLMLSPDRTLSHIAEYTFTILNASQGVFLFIFHCWFNQNARASMKRRFPKLFQGSSKGSLKTGSSGTNSTSSFR